MPAPPHSGQSLSVESRWYIVVALSLVGCRLTSSDQCEPPPNAAEFSESLYYGRNVNGAICLNNVCMCVLCRSVASCSFELYFPISIGGPMSRLANHAK